MKDFSEFSKLAKIAAEAAGKSILSLYHEDLLVTIKSDGSPQTFADQSSHQVIMDLLAGTGIPIVSEEARTRKDNPSHYWLVDPLDGTKDFLTGNDEFTVNIALIENGSESVS